MNSPFNSANSSASSEFGQVVFIDSAIASYQRLAAGVNSDAEVIILDSSKDGISQITEALAQKRNVSSVQVFSHGSAGGIQLGQNFYNLSALSQRGDELASWATALTEDGDLLFYGCNVAADSSGIELVNYLSQKTGADVAASDDLTGNAALGGDWDLEVATGAIESSLALQRSIMTTFDSVLVRVQAEDYVTAVDSTVANIGGVYRPQGAVDLEATTDVGGGFNVARTVQGEWLTYEVTIPTTGTYNLVARVASEQAAVHQLGVSLNGQSLTSFNFSGTGGRQTWQDVTARGINLTAGTHTLRMDVASNTDFSINYLDILPASSSPSPGPSPTPTANINFPNFANVSGLQFNGDSTLADTAVQITGAPFESGSVFYATPLAITPDTSFQTQFQFRISGGEGTGGGDGFTFVLQNSAAGLTAVGDPGGNVGYDNSDGGVAVDRSLAIEFDTSTNSWDSNANHIAILQNGDVTTELTSTLTPDAIPDLNNGDLLNAWVEYDGATNVLNVYISASTTKPTTPALSYTVDLASIVGTQAYAGFTSGTGLFSNAHAITSWSLTSSSGFVGASPSPSPTPGAGSTIALGSNATVSVSEGAGVATVRVVRTGDTQERVTVEYTTNEVGSATAGVDWIQPTLEGRANTGEVVFEVGETEKFITIPIVNDFVSEGNETFAVGLQRPSAGTLGAPRTVLINVIDDDTPTTISVRDASIAISEGAPNVTITVVRDGALTGTATVNYTTASGTAIAGADFTAATGTITFAPGQVSQTVTIPLIDDAVSEVNEAFTVTLSAATGAELSSRATSTVTILDNDAVLGSLTRRTVTTGLSQPTTIDWTPDGQFMLIADKGGAVEVMDMATLTRRPTPLIDISARVNNTRDRGLLGIAVHPNFPATPYVYLLYSYDPPETATGTGLAARDREGNRPSQLARVTVNPATMVADPASLVVLAGTNSTWAFTNGPDINSTGERNVPPSGIVGGTVTAPPALIEIGTQDNDPDRPGIQNQNIRDYLAMDSDSHSIGQVHFGPDGYLYLTNGDGTSYNFMDPRTVRVQDINNLSGKMLRLDPITGQGVPSNPFFNGDPNSNQSKVYQLGIRNSFRFTFDPITNNPVMGEVGWNSWEEINTGGAGANFGWPYYEGPSDTPYQTIPGVTIPGRSSVVFPILSRTHGAPDNASAVVVGDFYNPNTLIFGDLVGGTVYAATLDAARQVTNVQVVDSDLPYLADMEMGPDGRLYGVGLGSRTIYRWDPA
ncbi:DUF4347 domain-containing protein [Leptolyngbya ohadii]|uniref:DUF4347 domain-containing protein n=1 Tax=Leptolyngbya ohadii TaxID=1962290 RepID=UPI000B5A0CAC|nr:DUF4347 domain-containing protein [Leptolyngbya ohadii]